MRAGSQRCYAADWEDKGLDHELRNAEGLQELTL